MYEERIINGVVHKRSRPDDEWRPLSAVELTERYEQLREAVADFWEHECNIAEHKKVENGLKDHIKKRMSLVKRVYKLAGVWDEDEAEAKELSRKIAGSSGKAKTKDNPLLQENETQKKIQKISEEEE